MSENIFKRTSKLAFIIYFIFILLSFHAVSYYFFLSNFKAIEENQNKNNVQTILSKMNSEIDYIKNITEDYSKWDETYLFIKEQNSDYSDDNFGEGDETLEGIKIEFFIFCDIKDKIIFSAYASESTQKEPKLFEQEIVNRFKDYNATNTVFTYNSISYYLVKSSISNNDTTAVPNGYLYSGKRVTAQAFAKMSKSFKRVNINDINNKNNNFTLNSKYLKNVQVDIIYQSSEISNNIKLFENNNYIFTITTTSDRDIVNKGRETIIVYNALISIFLLVIFLTIFRYKTLLEGYSKKLKKEVEIKTEHLKEALSEIEEKNETLLLLANKDYLTKIDNRRSFFQQSERALEDSLQIGENISVLMMDLDEFKNINDTYGHKAGDEILITFCEIVNKIIDEKTIFGRVGGEEFAIVFVGKTIDESYKTSELIRATCEGYSVYFQDQEINFTVSFGLSQRENNETIDTLIDKADILLYTAKGSGKNKVIRALRD